MPEIIKSTSYDIFIGNDAFSRMDSYLLANYSGRKIFVLVDENTGKHCWPLIAQQSPVLKNAVLLEIESGEKSKSVATCEKLWLQLTEHRADRHSLFTNLGGGVVGDVGGFVASTYMRGIDFINIPTTLLSMVDASAGGKNGINFSGLKNQVGTFAKPEAVFISPSFLKTLPIREIKSGFAEVIKHTLIADENKWNELKQIESLKNVDWLPVIDDSVFIKNKIVMADYRERSRRKTLNFGHTIGHAIESYSMKYHTDPLKHGEAVAIGMIGEVFLSQRLAGFPEDKATEIFSFIQKHYPISIEADADEICELMSGDKKNENSEVNFVLLHNVADPILNQHPGKALILEAIDFSLQHIKPAVVQG